MNLSVLNVLGAVLLLSWVATIVGAGMIDSQRSRVREIVDALAMPLSMLSSKRRDCSRKLSTLRVLALALFSVVVGLVDRPLDRTELIALCSPALLLVLDTLLAQVPAAEFLAALTAWFGGKVAERTKTSVKVDTEGGDGTPPKVTVEQPKAPEQPVPVPAPAADGAAG